MPIIINVADLDSGNGKTYREENNEKAHSFEIGQLVEIHGQIRLFVAHHGRDCDGTPLYALTHQNPTEVPVNGDYCIYSFSEDGMVAIGG
jgi:hypothetical protein